MLAFHIQGRVFKRLFLTNHNQCLRQTLLTVSGSKAQSNIPTLLYLPWEKIDVKSSQSEVPTAKMCANIVLSPAE